MFTFNIKSFNVLFNYYFLNEDCFSFISPNYLINQNMSPKNTIDRC